MGSIPQFINKKGVISQRMKRKLDYVLENLSYARVQKYSLRRLLFIVHPDYVAQSNTTMNGLIMKKYNKCPQDLKKNIVLDNVWKIFRVKHDIVGKKI